MKPFFHRFFSVFVSAAVALGTSTALCSASVSAYEPDAATLSMTAQEIVDDITVGWNLGNTLDACNLFGLDSECSYGNVTTTKEMFDAVKERGFNAVRIPVTWFNHLDENDVIDPAWMERVAEVVGYALDNDLYCIIDVHHDSGVANAAGRGWLRASREKFEGEKERFVFLWEQIAGYFADYSQKLIFEGFNEILNDNNSWAGATSEDISVVNELNQLFVDTVRASGGNNAERCLIVTPYAARYESTILSSFSFPVDTIENHLIADIHCYVPNAFTLENGTSWSKENVNGIFQMLKYQLLSRGIPLVIGEVGANPKEEDEKRNAWAECYFSSAASVGVKCFWWDDGGKFTLLDRTELEWKYPDLISSLFIGATGTAFPGEKTEPAEGVAGDWDGDGAITLADVVGVQKYLLGQSTAIAEAWQAVDINGDGKVNAIDLVMVKRKLLQ